MIYLNLPVWYRFTKADLKRWAADKSGRGRNPLPGTENTPPEHRYSAGYEHVHSEYLVKPQYLNPITEQYQRQLAKALSNYGQKDWETVSVRDFCRGELTKCNLLALVGPKLFELAPDFLDNLWEFDDHIMSLALGFPKWIYPAPYHAQQRYLDAIQRYLDAAWAGFDWNNDSSVEEPWEEHFGARVSREVVKWFREKKFEGRQVEAGAIGILAWA